MLVTKEIEIDTGHRVPNHKSKCANLHGHRYCIEVGVDDKVITTEGISEEGMVIDFSDLKEIMIREIEQRLDHTCIFYEKDPDKVFLLDIEKRQVQRGGKTFEWVPFIPTAENIAKYLYDIIKVELQNRGIKIYHVRIWETPTSTAVYHE